MKDNNSHKSVNSDISFIISKERETKFKLPGDNVDYFMNFDRNNHSFSFPAAFLGPKLIAYGGLPGGKLIIQYIESS
jgi:hypothetical protein